MSQVKSHLGFLGRFDIKETIKKLNHIYVVLSYSEKMSSTFSQDIHTGTTF